MQISQPSISAFNSQDLILIGIAIFIGLIIGLEREYHNKTAGLRTLMLVSVGSCLFTILSIKIGTSNPDRIAANIITGIGFLGAGAIFKDENKISGLTTACTIWIMAALGMAIGSGHIYLAILCAVVVIFVLWIFRFFERLLDNFHKTEKYCITTAYSPEIIADIERIFYDFQLHSTKIYQSKTDNLLTIHWKITGPKKNHKQLFNALCNNSLIQEIEV